MKIYLSFSKIVEPRMEVHVIDSDPADNKFLECALESRSIILITGDVHLLRLNEFANVKILNANSFFEEFDIE